MDSWARQSLVPLSGLMNPGMLARLTGQRCIFPFYHVVSDQDLPHIKNLYAYPDEKQFEADLEALLKRFTPISIQDYLDEQENGGGKKKRKPGMVLSFDDGLSQCHSFIAPLLKQKGVPAMFFLNNDFIDNRGLFYRYKASALLEHLRKNSSLLSQAADYLAIPENQVYTAIMMINSRQLPLLDGLALHVEMDDALYMRDYPVYMSSEQVRHLMNLGFHVGAHGSDHLEFQRMEEKHMEAEAAISMKGIVEEFACSPALFAFPFSSDGVPEKVVRALLREGGIDVLFGTAGLKIAGNPHFIQRIPMEVSPSPRALFRHKRNYSVREVLGAEFLYYMAKGVVGRNHYQY